MNVVRAGASIGAFVVVVLAGCTTLDVRPMNLASPDPERVFYVLPFTQYDVAITRQVTKCGPSIDIETSIEATPVSSDDWREAYEIDQRSLSQLFNTAKLTVEFHEDESKQRTNRIRSINASVEDQTLPAIGHLIPSIGRLLSIPGPTGGPGQTATEACSAAVVAALNEVERLSGEIKRLTRALEGDNSAIARMRRERLARGLTDADPKDQALTDRLTLRAGRIASLLDLQTELAPHMRVVSHVQNVRWPEASGIFQTEPEGFNIDAPRIRRWMSDAAVGPAASYVRTLSVHMRLERTTPGGRNIFGDTLSSQLSVVRPAPTDQVDPEQPAAGRQAGGRHNSPPYLTRETPTPTRYVRPDGGLRYRVPMPGRLTLCQGVACDEHTPAESVMKQVDGPVAQLGFVQTIPIRARFLENVSFQATFSTSGAPTSIGYQSTGGGVAASQQLAAVLGQVATVREAERTWDAGAPQRELQRQQTLLQTLQAEAALANARNQDVQDTGALAIQIALVRARTAMLEAEQQWSALNPVAP